LYYAAIAPAAPCVIVPTVISNVVHSDHGSIEGNCLSHAIVQLQYEPYVCRIVLEQLE
jgi:hypothetical protein